MIRIEVKSASTTRKDGTTQKGKPYPRNQEAWAFTFDRDGKPNPYPVRCRLTIWDDEQPYAPGTYTLSPSAIYVNGYGDLEIVPRLVPQAPAKQAA